MHTPPKGCLLLAHTPLDGFADVKPRSYRFSSGYVLVFGVPFEPYARNAEPIPSCLGVWRDDSNHCRTISGVLPVLMSPSSRFSRSSSVNTTIELWGEVCAI